MNIFTLIEETVVSCFVLLTGFNSPCDSASQRPLDEPFEMEPNVLYFVRYKAVKKFVEEGKIDLY